MLNVKTPQEVLELIQTRFSENAETETVSLLEALGRTLGEDILAKEYVPDFNRSTVDGYAVAASDTFGCSDSMPALLELDGQVRMGEAAKTKVTPGRCAAVPTGGEVPYGADSVVMIEYSEDYGDGTIGILKPAAPGLNMIYRGDDVKPGTVVLTKGKIIEIPDIGALSAMGVTRVPVKKKVKVGIISTGDELIPEEETPGPGQIRDVNSSLLEAMMVSAGAVPVRLGIIKDTASLLDEAVKKAVETCDLVLISGGSSVGAKDATCQVMEQNGEVLFHGIAMKPGKPTILGIVNKVPVVGLPGHPVAALFVTKLYVVPLLDRISGSKRAVHPVTAVLEESVGANHGRAQYMGVVLHEKEGELHAKPIRSKSGLITSLAGSGGYFEITRDCEGLPKGSVIKVFSF